LIALALTSCLIPSHFLGPAIGKVYIDEHARTEFEFAELSNDLGAMCFGNIEDEAARNRLHRRQDSGRD
jgi:hypothetical protein